MEDLQRRKLDRYGREIVFMTDSAADFPDRSPGFATRVALEAIAAGIQRLAAEQISGAGGRRMSGETADDLLDELYQLLRVINRAAKATEGIPNIEQMFRMPRNRSQQNIVSAALAFRRDLPPYLAQFGDFDVPRSASEDIQTLVDRINAEDNLADASRERSGGATGGLIELFRQGESLHRRLDAIVRNKYRSNAQKLAAWTIASHLERSNPKSDKSPQ